MSVISCGVFKVDSSFWLILRIQQKQQVFVLRPSFRELSGISIWERVRDEKTSLPHNVPLYEQFLSCYFCRI